MRFRKTLGDATRQASHDTFHPLFTNPLMRIPWFHVAPPKHVQQAFKGKLALAFSGSTWPTFAFQHVDGNCVAHNPLSFFYQVACTCVATG